MDIFSFLTKILIYMKFQVIIIIENIKINFQSNKKIKKVIISKYKK